MARGARSSPTTTTTTTALAQPPKPSFRKIEGGTVNQQQGTHDNQARSYGYNNFDSFVRPDHYIRHIDPLEIDLATQVEYDMDEQDKAWLDAVNTERRQAQMDAVSYETFEILMDRLEKEWFDLTKNLPKPDLAMPSEDSTCAICDDSEGENSNAIVFCDGCNLAVHQDCYGVPYIPEGQWLCRKCIVSPGGAVSCKLCPNEGGAFKQTPNGEWVHLLCALWVPETRVENEVYMEPITGLEEISKQRWKLRCNICDIRYGACIQCSKAQCFLAFHATCARKEKLLLPMKSAQGCEPVTLTCYCERHLPKAQQEAREAALEAEASDEDSDSPCHSQNPHKGSKFARAYAKSYTLGPPLVPNLILTRLLAYVGKISIRKKQDFVALVCRYWSLKREARRGAPLLKRLHLEPWGVGPAVEALATSDSDTLKHDKEFKLDVLRRLRADLERVQQLTVLVRKRETRKYKQAKLINDVVNTAFLSREKVLREALNEIVRLDKHEYFKNPVNVAEVPDYLTVVSRPMSWETIDEKLDNHEYWNLQVFKDDVNLVIDNALLYNHKDSPIHKVALKLRDSCAPILSDLDSLRVIHEVATVVNVEDLMDVDLPLGDLEPPMQDLAMLYPGSTEIAEESELVIDKPPMDALLSYELPIEKPPPPLPPAPRPPRRRDRQAEARRRKEKLAATAASRDEDEAPRQSSMSLTIVIPRTESGTPAREATATTSPASVTIRIPPKVPSIRVEQVLLDSGAVVESPTQAEEGEVQVPEDKQAFKSEFQEDKRVHVEEKQGPAAALPTEKLVISIPPISSKLSSIRSPAETATESTLATAFPEPPKTPVTSATTTPPNTGTSKKSAPRKRNSVVGLGSLETPLVISDVDNKSSFKLFDQGWILPANTKRGGRSMAIENQPGPPRKRSKYDHTPTTPTPILTVHERRMRSLSRQGTEFVSEDGVPMDVDSSLSAGPSRMTTTEPSSKPVSRLGPPTGTPHTPASFPSALPGGIPVRNIVQAANGTFIIEELDTPAIRRRKSMMKKQQKQEREKERRAAEDSASTPAVGLEQGQTEDSPEVEQEHAGGQLDALYEQPATPLRQVQPLPPRLQGSVEQVRAMLEEEALSPLHIPRVESEPETGVVQDLKHRPSEHLSEQKWERDRPQYREVKTRERSSSPPPLPSPLAALPALSVPDSDLSSLSDLESMEVAGAMGVGVAELPPQSATTVSEDSIEEAEREKMDESMDVDVGGVEREDVQATPGAADAHVDVGEDDDIEREVDTDAAAVTDADGEGEPDDIEDYEEAAPMMFGTTALVPEPENQHQEAKEEPSESPILSRKSVTPPPADVAEEDEDAGESVPHQTPESRKGRFVPTRAGKKKRGRVRRPGTSVYIPNAGLIDLELGKKLPGGTLVWAKASTFPWWPAVVVEEKDSSVPPSVKTQAKEFAASKEKAGVVHIVQFYDKTSSWQFLPLKTLRYLGEDKELDADMLGSKSHRQKWKSSAQRYECMGAYKSALAEMDPTTIVGDDDDADGDDEDPIESIRLLDEDL